MLGPEITSGSFSNQAAENPNDQRHRASDQGFLLERRHQAPESLQAESWRPRRPAGAGIALTTTPPVPACCCRAEMLAPGRDRGHQAMPRPKATQLMLMLMLAYAADHMCSLKSSSVALNTSMLTNFLFPPTKHWQTITHLPREA